MRPSSVNLSDLALSACQELMSYHQDRQVELVVQPDMFADADPTLIRSLYSNLLSNAWKFTAARPATTIEVGGFSDEKGQSVFFVKDNGVGFNQSYAHKLFQPFERLHSADMYPGNGIGLATVLRIVRKHGGVVWAEGKEGEGAQFFFTL